MTTLEVPTELLFVKQGGLLISSFVLILTEIIWLQSASLC